MKISFKRVWIVAAAALALTACSDDHAKTAGGEPAPTGSASASASSPSAASPSASAADSSSASAPSSASPAAAQYTIDLQASGIEKPPEGTSLEPVDHDSAIYVASDHPDANVHLAFSLEQKGDFTVAEGSGTLSVGDRRVPFEIDQVSVMHKETLSGGQTLYFGGLQVDAKGGDPSTFAFGFRFIPQTRELQLRLSNGEGLVVFGGGGVIGQNEAEIEKIEAGHRPKN